MFLQGLANSLCHLVLKRGPFVWRNGLDLLNEKIHRNAIVRMGNTVGYRGPA